jgi:3-hydroxyacyl-CoA dehydrogenase
MGDLAALSRDGDVAVITIDNPPVNALGAALVNALGDAIAEVERDPAIKAAVLIGGGRTFIAGADIREFQASIEKGGSGDPGLNPVLNRIEDCRKPIVAAIHGSALGGGLETAMACHYRVAVASAQVGQPEVQLGLIPGAGGTQRLPRLAGVAASLTMCTAGAPRSAGDALRLGIIDEIVDGDLRTAAVAYARARIADGPRPTRERNEKLGAADPALFETARRDAAKASRNQPAPLMAIDAIEAATRLPFAEGLAFEGELFRKALFSPQAKGLIHAFFGEREVARIPFAKDAPLLPVRMAAVVGAGTMGGGIAMALANAGIPVLLREADEAALDRGMNNIRRNYSGAVAKGRMKQEQMDQRLALITPVLSYERFGEADLIIEAVFEKLDVKRAVFTELDRVARPDAILATNTSTLDIDEVAAVTSRPANVIGMHFFSPANIMKMLEVVRGRETSDPTLMTVMATGKRLGKIAVLAGNCAGFIANRVYFAGQRHAELLVEMGAAPEDVDSALYEFGMAMGPLATDDLIGLDVCRDIRAELSRRGTLPAESHIEDRLLEAGRRGQKSGAGWYRYDENRRAQPDPQAVSIIEQHRTGSQRFTAQEIVQRVLFPMADEGARILREGHALRAVDIDMVFIHGFGFPAYRGGPMFWAESAGHVSAAD